MKLYRYSLTIALTIAFLYSSMLSPSISNAYQLPCIDCVKNVTDPDYYPRQRSDNGQLDNVVTVKISADWGNPIPSKLLTAVTFAMSRWNLADAQGPFIQFDQNAADDKVSVLIKKKDLPDLDLAETTSNDTRNGFSTGTTEMSLDPENLLSADITTDHLAGRVAHELGHSVKGLHESICPGINNTIMRGSNIDGTRDVTQIQPADVTAANRWRTNRESCPFVASPRALKEYYESEPGEVVEEESYEGEVLGWDNCQEIWEYNPQYYCNDGCVYIGTIARRISTPCSEYY
jgi:hypothetical protein